MELINGFQAVNGYRLVWHSEAYRQTWENRINQISNEWTTVERQSVVAGVRRAFRQPIYKGVPFENLRLWSQRHGLHMKIIKAVGAFGGFAHRYLEGDDMYVTVVARNAADLDTDNEKELDALLDYPECCQRFFFSYFPSILDPVWQAAEATPVLQTDSFSDGKYNSIALERVSIHHALLRYASIRTVPHIPCRFDCEASERLGEAMLSLYSREAQEWLTELLSQPIIYDLYRGVAIIKTPFFRYVVGSNYARHRYVIELNHETARRRQSPLAQLTQLKKAC